MFIGNELLPLISVSMSVVALAMSIICMRRGRASKNSSKLRERRSGRTSERRIKRYVLMKVVCLDDADVEQFSKELIHNLYRALGPVLSARCGIALVAFRRDLGRAIVRVSGEADCVRYVLAAISTLHALLNVRCLAIPLRVSGCLTRLRKALRVYRAG